VVPTPRRSVLFPRLIYTCQYYQSPKVGMPGTVLAKADTRYIELLLEIHVLEGPTLIE